METPSALRLNILRGGYLFMAAGLGVFIWPRLIADGPNLPPAQGIILSLLCGLGLVAVLGLRYPLRMLPLMLFEITWKVVWLVRIALPLWFGHRMDDATRENLFAVGMVVVLPFIVPWDYVWRQYVLQAGDPWWKRRPEQEV